eukprot:360454-Chlamydomonas_euryale.AAC.5
MPLASLRPEPRSDGPVSMPLKSRPTPRRANAVPCDVAQLSADSRGPPRCPASILYDPVHPMCLTRHPCVPFDSVWEVIALPPSGAISRRSRVVSKSCRCV